MGGLALSVTKKAVYLAGAIEHAPDGGKQWREELARFVEERLGLPVFNPCVQEAGLLTPEEKLHLRSWKVTDPERFRGVIRRFVDNDLKHLLTATEFVICFWDEFAAKGAGTAGEVTLAYHANIPVYLVCGVPTERVPGWILACATEIFVDFSSLKHRLQQLYRSRAPLSPVSAGINQERCTSQGD